MCWDMKLVADERARNANCAIYNSIHYWMEIQRCCSSSAFEPRSRFTLTTHQARAFWMRWKRFRLCSLHIRHSVLRQQIQATSRRHITRSCWRHWWWWLRTLPSTKENCVVIKGLRIAGGFYQVSWGREREREREKRYAKLCVVSVAAEELRRSWLEKQVCREGEDREQILEEHQWRDELAPKRCC